MGIREPWRNPLTSRRCDSKRAYKSEQKANKAALAAQERTAEPIVSYFCPDCGFHHIGHAKPGFYQEVMLKKAFVQCSSMTQDKTFVCDRSKGHKGRHACTVDGRRVHFTAHDFRRKGEPKM